MTKKVLEIQNVSAEYSGAKVLHNVSMHVHLGEIVCIIGNNAAGKSTLAQAITGNLQISNGSVSVGGKISYVPQGRSVFPTLTVKENVLIGTGLKDVPEHVQNLFSVVVEKENVPAGKLSGGEQRMIALARALSTNPDILILDEPTAGVSPKYIKAFYGRMLRIRDSKKMSVLIIEHNLNSLLHVADRAYNIRGGTVSGILEKKDLRNPEKLYATLLQ